MDASQGSEEMVEHLSEKVLHQEEQIQQLEEEKNDLASNMSFVSATCIEHLLIGVFFFFIGKLLLGALSLWTTVFLRNFFQIPRAS